MKSDESFKRPSLTEALNAWKKLLAERGLATESLWVFEENLCLEKSSTQSGGFQLGFQTQFSPPPDDALDIAFEHFCETGAPVVFYRLGECRGQSVCVLLCDPWFAGKQETDGFLKREEWRILFYTGPKCEIEAITDLSRWLRRVKRRHALHDLDFCMALGTIDELKIHGRALAPYERFAEMLLNRLRRFLKQPA
jgi:hypothetical protein